MSVPDDREIRQQADAVHQAVSSLLRWATRAEVRQALQGGASADLLSATDLWLIDLLAASGAVRASALATRQGVDRSTMTTQLRRLSDHGLVERRPDPQDGRAVLVGLTPEGHALRAALANAAALHWSTVLSSWTRPDRRELVRLITRLTDELPALPVGHRVPPPVGSRRGADGDVR